MRRLNRLVCNLGLNVHPAVSRPPRLAAPKTVSQESREALLGCGGKFHAIGRHSWLERKTETHPL